MIELQSRGNVPALSHFDSPNISVRGADRANRKLFCAGHNSIFANTLSCLNEAAEVT
jgi:hypothetical protein